MSLENESVEISDEGSLHNYFTQIPNIIFQLNLDTYEFKAYCVLKMTAGDRGSCFKSTKTLCEEIGCQKPKLIELKRALVEKGLITIKKRKHENGNCLPDLITIIDIWSENMQFMLKKYPPKSKEKSNLLGIGGGNLGLPGVVIDDYQGGNLGLPKQEHIEQEKKQQQQEPEKKQHNINYLDLNPSPAAAVSSKNEINQRGESSKPKEIIHPCLIPIDIPEVDKIEISKRFHEETVKNAIIWAQHPQTKITKGLSPAIKWACQNKPKMPEKAKEKDKSKSSIDYISFNKSYYRHICQTASKNGISLIAHGFRELNEYVETDKDRLYFKDASFLEQLTNVLRKKGIDNSALIKSIRICKDDLMTQ